jgi:hypothetical protein
MIRQAPLSPPGLRCRYSPDAALTGFLVGRANSGRTASLNRASLIIALGVMAFWRANSKSICDSVVFKRQLIWCFRPPRPVCVGINHPPSPSKKKADGRRFERLTHRPKSDPASDFAVSLSIKWCELSYHTRHLCQVVKLNATNLPLVTIPALYSNGRLLVGYSDG